MRFCPKCDNLLIPKNKKLFCKTCDDYFNLESNVLNEYILVKTIDHDETDFTPLIIKKPLN